MVNLSKTIFKAYDIRGIIDKTLDAGVAYQIGAASAAPRWPRARRKS
jgi:phosphomannomutase/phosphoglucomutase